MGKALHDDKAKADSSCGLHVHVDARDLAWSDVDRLFRLWLCVQDAMYSLVAPSRKQNHYCEPWNVTLGHSALLPHKDAKGCAFRRFKDFLLATMYGSPRRVTTAKQDKYHAARYKGLNLHSYFYRRTIEFRLHHGTVNPDKMTGWASVCVALVDAAVILTEMDMRRLERGRENGESAFNSLALVLDSMNPRALDWAITRRTTLAGGN